MEEFAKGFQPKMIIAGTSAYSRFLDYQRMRKVLCDLHAAVCLTIAPYMYSVYMYVHVIALRDAVEPPLRRTPSTRDTFCNPK